MITRKSQRFSVTLPCSFMNDQFTGEGTVLDLSMEGCKVSSNRPVIDVYMEMFIYLPEQIPPLPVELAVIRWSKGPILGLEFIRIADRHQARLRQHLQDLERTLTTALDVIPRPCNNAEDKNKEIVKTG
jgi:hypothetical protein